MPHPSTHTHAEMRPPAADADGPPAAAADGPPAAAANGPPADDDRIIFDDNFNVRLDQAAADFAKRAADKQAEPGPAEPSASADAAGGDGEYEAALLVSLAEQRAEKVELLRNSMGKEAYDKTISEY